MSDDAGGHRVVGPGGSGGSGGGGGGERDAGAVVRQGLAELAKELGWSDWQPLMAIDQHLFVERLAQASASLAGATLRARKEGWDSRAWVSHAWWKMAERMNMGPVDDWEPGSGELFRAVFVAPAIWLGCIGGLCGRLRKSGRLQNPMYGLIFTQGSYLRHGVTPVGRATRIPGAGGVRDVFLLVRDREIELEIARSPVLGLGGLLSEVSGSRAAPAPRIRVAGSMGGSDLGISEEGWEM